MLLYNNGEKMFPYFNGISGTVEEGNTTSILYYSIVYARSLVMLLKIQWIYLLFVCKLMSSSVSKVTSEFNDWKHAHEMLLSHENSKQHLCVLKIIR